MCWEVIEYFLCSNSHSDRIERNKRFGRPLERRDEPHIVIRKCVRARNDKSGLPCAPGDGREAGRGTADNWFCCSKRCCDALLSAYEDDESIMREYDAEYLRGGNLNRYNNYRDLHAALYKAKEEYAAAILTHGYCPKGFTDRAAAYPKAWIPVSEDPFPRDPNLGQGSLEQAVGPFSGNPYDPAMSAWASRLEHARVPSRNESDTSSRPQSRNSNDIRMTDRPASRNTSDVGSVSRPASRIMRDASRSNSVASSDRNISSASRRDARSSSVAPTVARGARFSNSR